MKTATNLANYLANYQNAPIINEVLKMTNWISKSPYSYSFYDTTEKTWGYTPEGSMRFSDHWNFVSRGETHCVTNVPITKDFAVCIWQNDVYNVLLQFNKLEEPKRLIRSQNKNFVDTLQKPIERIKRALFESREKRRKLKEKRGFKRYKSKRKWATLKQYQTTLEHYCAYYKNATVKYSESNRRAGGWFEYEHYTLENCLVHSHPLGKTIYHNGKEIYFSNREKNLSFSGVPIKKQTFKKHLKNEK